MIRKLYCQTCQTFIARFDDETIHQPLTHDQFKAVVETNMMPAPFVPPAFTAKADGWEWFKCPACGKRPIHQADKIYMRDDGFFDVPKKREAQILDEPMVMVESSSGYREIVPLESLPEPVKDSFKGLYGIQAPNPLQCLVCGKVCKNKIGLNGHMKSHKG